MQPNDLMGLILKAFAEGRELPLTGQNALDEFVEFARDYLRKMSITGLGYSDGAQVLVVNTPEGLAHVHIAARTDSPGDMQPSHSVPIFRSARPGQPDMQPDHSVPITGARKNG